MPGSRVIGLFRIPRPCLRCANCALPSHLLLRRAFLHTVGLNRDPRDTMHRFMISLFAAALCFITPTLANAHCGTCGVGEAAEAAEDAEEPTCAHCAGDEAAECTCAHTHEGDEAADGHAACAFCAGDETAECTCAHAEEAAEEHAACAFCAGDETAECTCVHDEEAAE